MAQEADRRRDLQMLQFPHKLIQKKAFWSFWCFMAQEADWPKGFQMLQFLYKLITKESIWQLLVLHGSGARLAPGLSDASIPLQIDYNTKHFVASGASWLRTPIGPGAFRCFNSFTN
jgi:hypothetical protein